MNDLCTSFTVSEHRDSRDTSRSGQTGGLGQNVQESHRPVLTKGQVPDWSGRWSRG